MPGKYRFVKAPKEYPGKIYKWGHRVLEHRLVWWQHTGEVPPPGFDINHKNEWKDDNRFENLEKMAVGRHLAHHNLKAPNRQIPCGWCGELLLRTARDVRTKRKAGQRKFFCDSSHAAQYGHRKK